MMINVFPQKKFFFPRILPLLLITGLLTGATGAKAQNVDYSVVSVPEETGMEFMKVTKSSDYVCMPIVRRGNGRIDWLSNRILGISPDGTSIAYLSFRNNTTNIFIKELGKQGSSTQRTNRSNVLDFSYSPDGKYICFSETRGNTNQIFQTDARNGYVCRQITTGDQDYSPVWSWNMQLLFFVRTEANGASVWSHNTANNFLSSYTAGMYVCRTDGTGFSQLTYHAADDLSPAWSADGKHIYFISQRGDAEGTANIWRMKFPFINQ